MTQHDKEVIEATVDNAERLQTLHDDSQKDTNAPRLSKRAQAALESADPLTESLLAKVLGNQYSPESPEGLLNAGVAENSLMADWLLEHYSKNLNMTFTDLTYGDALAGSKRLYKALGKLFEQYFRALKPVKGEHMICGTGVSAVLDQLTDKLCDEGETILVARPYYNGFDVDVSARCRAAMAGVEIPAGIDPASPASLDYFEAKLQELKASGKNTPRAVILCNPNNPLGFIYPRETILEYCRFCQRHNLHLISDEIYALSLYKNRTNSSPPAFHSLLSIDVMKEAQCDPARVHVVYGMSKDFGSNGLRVGVLVSQHNKMLIKAFQGSALLMKISSPADVLWSSIIGDEKVLTEYLDKAQSRASDTLHFTIEWLDKLNIQHSNPVAGHFIWIDLRAYLPQRSNKGKKLTEDAAKEWELFMRLLEEGNVYLAPGVIYHSTIPGFFRLTFTLRREYLKVGMERIEGILRKVQEENTQSE